MNLEELSPKSRFSNRVENYAKYRPDYPKEIVSFLRKTIGLTEKHIIADIGSGTGISSKIFLDNGNQVYGIEPNREMREAGEKYLSNYTNFHSIEASSEDTKLECESIDMIISGQAFHWFEPEATRKEFLRILKPNGYVVLFSNRRKSSNNEFMSNYAELISKYAQEEFSKPLNTDKSYFFDLKPIHQIVFPNLQVFDLKRLKGDLVSYSYIPNEGDPKFISMITEFENLFEKNNNNGLLNFDYETVVYYCKMK